jgi:hypothetical protein
VGGDFQNGCVGGCRRWRRWRRGSLGRSGKEQDDTEEDDSQVQGCAHIDIDNYIACTYGAKRQRESPRADAWGLTGAERQRESPRADAWGFTGRESPHAKSPGADAWARPGRPQESAQRDQPNGSRR